MSTHGTGGAVSRRRPRIAALATAVLIALGVTVTVALAAPASATTATNADIEAAARALDAGESVYVAPGADPRFTTADADQLSAQVRDSGHVYFIAVLPASAAVAQSSRATLAALVRSVGQPGTYALWIGDESSKAFRAYSATATAAIGEAATLAFRQEGDNGPASTLTTFVDSANPILDDVASGGDGGVVTDPGTDTGGGAYDPVDRGSSGIGGFFWLVIGGIAALIGGGAWWSSRKAKQAAAERTAAVRRTVDEDVTEFGEQVARLDVDDPRLDDAGRADAQSALDSYERAKSLSAGMRRPEDAQDVTTELEAGRFAMASVQARVEGRPLPERRPPCFVDPRHGPSVEDMLWAPDGGAARPVPLCAACATTLRTGGLPAAREIEMAGTRMPYWRGGAAYAPYAGGYFARSGADIMPALFMGTMIGSMWASPTVIQAPQDMGGWNNGGGGGFGGGDFGGGGGFGGGDFGGGGDF